eukprot:gene18792-biopygen6943
MRTRRNPRARLQLHPPPHCIWFVCVPPLVPAIGASPPRVLSRACFDHGTEFTFGSFGAFCPGLGETAGRGPAAGAAPQHPAAGGQTNWARFLRHVTHTGRFTLGSRKGPEQEIGLPYLS